VTRFAPVNPIFSTFSLAPAGQPGILTVWAPCASDWSRLISLMDEGLRRSKGSRRAAACR